MSSFTDVILSRNFSSSIKDFKNAVKLYLKLNDKKYVLLFICISET